MRSNATVGPPLECLFYRNDSLEPYELYSTLEESHPYLIAIRQDWDKSIRSAVERLQLYRRSRRDAITRCANSSFSTTRGPIAKG